jgi:hypothetical protein
MTSLRLRVDMIIVAEDLKDRLTKVWNDLQRFKNEEGLFSQHDLDKECILWMENKLSIDKEMKEKEEELSYFDETFPLEEHFDDDDRDLPTRIRPCPVCKNPDACESYCPTCDT